MMSSVFMMSQVLRIQYKRRVTILESFSFELIALQVGECRADPQVGSRFY